VSRRRRPLTEHNWRTSIEDALSGGVDGARSAEDDRVRKRALPIIGPGVDGAIPGTRPGRSSSRLDRWSGRP
jgi:hypothetical protein